MTTAWSVAQVLSHIGSEAEIFGLFLDAGLSGQDPSGPEAFAPIWGVWNAKSPGEQAADALRADETMTERFESIDDEQRKRFALKVFGMDLRVDPAHRRPWRPGGPASTSCGRCSPASERPSYACGSGTTPASGRTGR